MNVICISSLHSSAQTAVKCMKLLRRYLFQVQDSIYQGTLTPRQFDLLQKQVAEVIDSELDQVFFYFTYRDKELYEKHLGKAVSYRFVI